MLTLLTLISKAIATMVKHGPRPLVICGPSGSGKSTLINRLFTEFPETFGFSVSHTTRKPRPGEQDGVHYNYVTKEEMKAAIERGEFLETATFGGNIYGTSKHAVRVVQAQGKVCVLDIEIQGVEQIRGSELNPILIFINPPSIEELERRLRGRATETEASLKIRLETARHEIEYGNRPGNFQCVVHNDSLKQAYTELKDFVITELKKEKEQGITVSLKQVPMQDDF